jgi:FKBP-type peptidyl-prolyl cis-trans isomerase FkpA
MMAIHTMPTMRHSIMALFALTVLLTAAACGSSESSLLIKTDLRPGTGAEATTGTQVSVHYTGWLQDTSKTDGKGTQFDSSVGGPPFGFRLGGGQVIAGWDQGVVGMKVGGQRQLVIPADLGYGAAGAGGVIPPNATLVFDVELLGVQ